MEAKKNPAKDVHRKSFMFFQIGLGLSIALVITAFEWRTEVRKVKPRIIDNPEINFVLLPPTVYTNPEPPRPKQEQPQPVKPNRLITISDEPMESGSDLPDDGTIDQSELPESTGTTLSIAQDPPEVCDDCLVSFPERAAEPIGGYVEFYNIIRKNLKYPRQAQHMHISGRVFVEFIVNRDGIPSDIKVSRGIGAGCDEEAIRVIALTKWNPGKQRGKPVRIKMVMPIVFHLNE
jgi:periplasmic protein TonB